MEERTKGPLSLSDALDERLSASAGDPYAVLADLVAGERRADHVEVLSLHGQTLGSVRLLRILGTGGMGVTYEGVEPDGAHVAVKVLGALSDSERVRFESECQILRTLDHPNVVRYRSHGIGPTGHAFLTMDLVDGTDLETVLSTVENGGALDDVGEALLLGVETQEAPHSANAYRRRVLRMVATIAEALHHVHEQGVVHRDVKPGNIIVQPDLTPVLIDFGLGRDLFRELSWTRSGAVVGTVGWMAPEQLDGRLQAIGPRTDVFALGLLLYRALTGVELQRDLGDLVRLRRGYLRLTRSDRQGLDPEVLGVLYGCLEPEPRRRYASAAELAGDLRALLRGDRPSRRPPVGIAWLWRTARGRMMALGCVVVVGALLWLMLAPRWTTVTIMGMEDDQDGRLTTVDGQDVGILPLENWVVARGSVHDLVYRSRRTPDVPIHFVADREVMRVNVLHVVNSMVDAISSERRLCKGEGMAVLDCATFVEGASLEVDGVEILWDPPDPNPPRNVSQNPNLTPARVVRLLLDPGVRRIQVTEPDGAAWIRDLNLLPARLEPLVLGGHHLGSVAARHRITWVSVLADRPEELEVHLTGPVGPFMDGPAQVRVADQLLDRGLVYEYRNTAFAPLVAGEVGVVELEIRFPEPVRSGMAVFEVQCNNHLGNDLQIEWSVEGRSWTLVPFGRYGSGVQPETREIRGLGPFGGGIPALDFHGLPEPGTTWLRIRARMLSGQDPGAASTVRFLRSYVNTPERADCALEVVGDPSPEPRGRR